MPAIRKKTIVQLKLARILNFAAFTFLVSGSLFLQRGECFASSSFFHREGFRVRADFTETRASFTTARVFDGVALS